MSEVVAARRGATLPSYFASAMTAEGVSELDAILSAASRLVADPAFGPDAVVSFNAASRALDVAWHAVTDAIRGDVVAANHVIESASLVDLLNRIRGAERLLRAAEDRRRTNAAAAVRTALSRLRSAKTVVGLFDQVPDAVCTLGFDRSIISRIDDARWMPENLLVSGDLEWSNEILVVGRAAPPEINPNLYESEIVRRKVGILVTEVQSHLDRTHTSVASSSGTRSYVAAPLMPGSNVIGFLHADRYFHRGEVDETDRDVLVDFASGLSLVLHAAVLADRLQNMRDQVEAISRGYTVDLEDFLLTGPRPRPPHELVTGGMPTSAEDTARTLVVPGEAQLTRREVEVLRLMATGATNLQIANRLVISDGTVKSHVKNVLRKLQVANRAEAAARWMSLQTARSQNANEGR